MYRSLDVWLCGNMVSKWYNYLAMWMSCRMVVQWYVYLVVWLSGWVKAVYKPVLYYHLKLVDIHLQCHDADEHVFKKNRQWHCQEDNCNIQSRHVVILMLFHACRFYNYMLTKVCFNCFLFVCHAIKRTWFSWTWTMAPFRCICCTLYECSRLETLAETTYSRTSSVY